MSLLLARFHRRVVALPAVAEDAQRLAAGGAVGIGVEHRLRLLGIQVVRDFAGGSGGVVVGAHWACYFWAMMHYLLYGSGPSVVVVFGVLVLGVLGGWVLLLRLAARLIGRETSLALASGLALLVVLILFALYILTTIIAAVSSSSGF